MADTIDILLATYNGEQYIKEQLDSIEMQTYKEWKLIVRDDYSTDNTVSIIKQFAKKYPNKVEIINSEKPSGGAKNNFFILLKYSTNKYVACCDQDDVWLENKLEVMYDKIKQLEISTNNDIPLLVYSDLMVVDKELHIIDESFFDYSQFKKNIVLNDILIENCITGCAMLFNDKLRGYLLKPYNLSKIIMHDWLAGLIAYSFGKACYIDQPLIMYRQHSTNSVGANTPKRFTNLVANAKKGFKFARNVVTNTYEQIEEFYKFNYAEVENSGLNIIKGYANLKNKRKLSRLLFYKKNGIKKIGLIRKIWLIVFG